MPTHRCDRTIAATVRWLLPAALLLFAAAGARTAEVSRIDVYPPDINLSTASDRQAYIVVATRADGVTLDVTSEAAASPADAAVVRLDGRTLLPVADGQTTLRVEHAGHEVSVPVRVADAGTDRPISFQLDVMPVFMRGGCNTGACHGSARGQDGFLLSLFGFDPESDHFRLTREMPSRRLNLAVPAESLLLEKAVGSVPHTGGKRFDVDSEYYRTLLRWIEAGAPADSGEVASLERLELFPPEIVLEGPDAGQQMVARAVYSDGTDRDVTHLAAFLSNNDNSAEIDSTGMVRAAKRGEAFLLARLDTETVGSQVLVLAAGSAYSPSDEQPANYIDELIDEKLRKIRMLPSPLCSDEVFLRRVTLDIVGRMPTIEEQEQFLADASPAKRDAVIDRLLESKEFSEIWAMQFAEMLMMRSTNQLSYKSMFLYWDWLNRNIADNVPLDDMVRELLASTGGTFSAPATNFYQVENDTLKTAENVAQSLLGIRMQCAQCHNHPFDRWTMDDYYAFAGFFAQIGRKPGEDYREQIIFDRGGGEVRHPVGNRVVPVKFLGGDRPEVAPGEDRRAVLAEWLTAPDNPYFAPAIANRVWTHFFGLGIVEPIDDVRISNPPSNPQLYEALGRKLVEYDYDLKRLVRDICRSNAYQRSTQANESNREDQRNFARARVRRLRAEILLDSISQVTETRDKFRGLPLGARAVQIADGATTNYFLTTFGRSPRETVCACDVKTEPTLSQALHLLNGDTVAGKVVQGGVVKRLLEAGNTPEQVVEQLYRRCLCRPPGEQERAALLAAVAEADNTQAALEDVFWAVLNSQEFLFNH